MNKKDRYRFQKKKKNRNCKDTRNSRSFPRSCPLPRREITFKTTFSLERHPTGSKGTSSSSSGFSPFSQRVDSRPSEHHPHPKEKKKGGGKYRSRAHRVSKQGRRIPTWKKILRNVGFVSHLASVRRISKCFFINSHLNDFRLPSSLSLSPTAHLLPSPPRLNTFLRLNKAPRLRRVIRGETTARRTTMFRRRRRFSPLVGNYLPSGNKLKAKQR